MKKHKLGYQPVSSFTLVNVPKYSVRYKQNYTIGNWMEQGDLNFTKLGIKTKSGGK